MLTREQVDALLAVAPTLHGCIREGLTEYLKNMHREAFGQEVPCPGLLYAPDMNKIGCPHGLEGHAMEFFVVGLGAARN